MKKSLTHEVFFPTKFFSKLLATKWPKYYNAMLVKIGLLSNTLLKAKLLSYFYQLFHEKMNFETFYQKVSRNRKKQTIF